MDRTAEPIQAVFAAYNVPLLDIGEVVVRDDDD
jgi:hypothetical protein